ncbi:hypothetical protein [Streptomyces sp. NPDC004014]
MAAFGVGVRVAAGERDGEAVVGAVPHPDGAQVDAQPGGRFVEGLTVPQSG